MSQERQKPPLSQASVEHDYELLRKMRDGEIPIDLPMITSMAQTSFTPAFNYLWLVDEADFPMVINNMAEGMLAVANAYPDKPLRFIGYSTMAVNFAVTGRTAAELARDRFNIYRGALTEAQGLTNLGRYQDAQQAYIIADENLLRTPTPVSILEAKLPYGQSLQAINDIRLRLANNQDITENIARAQQKIFEIGSRTNKDDLAAQLLAIEAKIALADSLVTHPDIARQVLAEIEQSMSKNLDLRIYDHRLAFVTAKVNQPQPP